MTKFTTAFAMCSLLAMPGFAYSAATSDNPSGPYVGAGWGQFKLGLHDLSDVGIAVNSVTDSDDNAWKIFAGWRFNPYFALEGAYVDFGRPGDRFDASGSDGDYRVIMKGFSPTAIISLPIGPIELFAKGGAYYYDAHVKAHFDSSGGNIDSSNRRNDAMYGGGIGASVTDHLHIRAEYERLDIQNAKKSDAFWLTAALRF